MATVSKWTPFGVALDVTATGGTVTRTSATQFTVKINVSWETYYSGAQTNYGMTAASGGVTHTISAFNGTKRSSGSGSFTGTYSISGNGSASKTITVTFRNFNTDNGDSATKSVSFNVTVPAWTSYTVSYNANGGTGAPGAQTKWKDQTLKLSTTKPTRTGYSFQGWATSASGGVAYASGANYTGNATLTLYAVWKANTYTVKYDANGGTGAPANQTKTYGKTLTLSSTKPTRTNYNFLGWATSSSATAATYAAGGSYTSNSATTLYAVWSLAYQKPRIVNVSVIRCDVEGAASDEGQNGLVSFDWECDHSVTSIIVMYKLASDESWTSVTVESTGTNGSVSHVIGEDSLSVESTYDVRITVSDDGGSSYAVSSLSSMRFTIDYLAGGTGVAFGKAAELENTAEFGFDAKFNGPVYGTVVGLDRLPEIPENDDFNNYITPGCWSVRKNAVASTISNIPVARAGRLEVISSTGEGIRSEQWSYLRQIYKPYNSENATWERDISRGEDNVWIYYDWWKSSLTPNASKRVYDEPVVLFNGASTGTITLSQSANNFSYLEIFFTDNNGKKGGYMKLHSPYTSDIGLSIVETGAGSNTYIRRTAYTLDGTTLTPNTDTAGYSRLNGTNLTHVVGTNYIKITRILGRNS